MVWGALVALGWHFSRHGSAAHTEWHMLNFKSWCSYDAYLQIWQTQTALGNYTFFSWSNWYSWKKISFQAQISLQIKKARKIFCGLQPRNGSNKNIISPDRFALLQPGHQDLSVLAGGLCWDCAGNCCGTFYRGCGPPDTAEAGQGRDVAAASDWGDRRKLHICPHKSHIYPANPIRL